MLESNKFIKYLSDIGVSFFAGVPDSLLSGFCASLAENVDAHHHVIAANEGNAVALAAGYHMATGKVPCVYLQNSGLGNTINPLISLADPSVYSFPMLLLIGWRGEPRVVDEPQHVRQGELTIPLLDTLGIPNFTLPKDDHDAVAAIEHALRLAKSETRPVAILVKKGTFATSTNDQGQKDPQREAQLAGACDSNERSEWQRLRTKDKGLSPQFHSAAGGPRTTDYGPRANDKGQLTRERAIELITEEISPQDMVVSTTGKASRELYEIRECRGESHSSDFLVVGSMGHASQIAAGVALAKSGKRVVCLDGDGALLMHMGGVAVNASLDIPNFRHIILNNGVHDSVGGMPTVGLSMSVDDMAGACGYAEVVSVKDEDELLSALPEFMMKDGPSLMNVIIKPGARKDLGRPAITPLVCKENFMKQLQS